MKIQKVLFLASVFILPTQALFAENARLAQPAASKSTVAVPAKTTSKLKMVAPIRQGNVAADPVATSGPATVQKPTLSSRDAKIAKPAGPGPNLVVSVSYEHDVCAIHPSPLGGDLFNAGCDVIVKIKNQGGSTTSEANTIQVNMSYSDRTGTAKLLRFIPALKANEEKTIIIRSGLIHSFKKASSFTAVVDRPQDVTETNENDNTAVFWLGL
ncbi:MAG: hypothetical protein COA63_009040 [Methylophaga sp.]|nr:hypothetical protein [Methylophaga sp.]